MVRAADMLASVRGRAILAPCSPASRPRCNGRRGRSNQSPGEMTPRGRGRPKGCRLGDRYRAAITKAMRGMLAEIPIQDNRRISVERAKSPVSMLEIYQDAEFCVHECPVRALVCLSWVFDAFS